jgi:hypothetical protein
MSIVSDELLRRWIENWTETGKALEAIRRSELAAMTDADVREAVADLLTIPLPPDLPLRFESGLVEQQRWFAKLHPKT